MKVLIPKKINIIEVGPRDGLQNESHILSVAERVKLIEKLIASGCQNIQIGSFVAQDIIPALANTGKVFKALNKKKIAKNIKLICLVPNIQGLLQAKNIGVKNIEVFTAATDGFATRNINCTVKTSLKIYQEVIQEALNCNMKIRGTISCALGCPFDGNVNISTVVNIAKLLYQMGCYEIVIADTIGIGSIVKIKKLIAALQKYIPVDKLAVHFHDSYGQGLVNVYAALSMGVNNIDSAVSGLGGCPSCKLSNNINNNIATEDLLYMLNGLKIKTTLNLSKILATSLYISKIFNRPPNSKTGLLYTYDKNLLAAK